MTSLFGDFETELAPPDALTACVDALDGLGWQVDSVEGHRIECTVTSGPGDGGATLEVELTETEGGCDIRLIGEDKGDASLEEQELGAVMDQARDAIGERIDAVEAPEGEAEASEEEPPAGDDETPTTTGEDQPQEEPAQPQEHQEEPQARDQERAEHEEQPAEQLPAEGWFPDPWGGERQRYWDGESWTGHVHPPDGESEQGVEPEQADEPERGRQTAAAEATEDTSGEGDRGDSKRWLPRSWQTVAVGVLVFCVGGAVGALAKPSDNETAQRTQTIRGAPKVQTETVTQTQAVDIPEANPGSPGPTVAGAAASSPPASSRGAPAGASAAPASPAGTSSVCDPSYAPICLDPSVSDYDCLGKGDGPKYVDGPLTVVGEDRWQLDESDNDGLACE